MDQAVTVALVRGDNRRGAVAQALALLVADVARCVTPRVLIHPSLAGPRENAGSTHPETLSASLDAFLAAGASEVTVASSAPDASALFRRLGYSREAWGRPVAFVDLDRGEVDWDALEWSGNDGSRRSARVARTIAAAPCRVSLATASPRISTADVPSLRSVLGCLNPADRPRGSGLLSEFEDEFGFFVALARRVGPQLSLVDCFEKGRRGGGRRGKSGAVGSIVAGLDPVAVDTVAAAVNGFDPREIELLSRAQAAGLGIADLDTIRVLGDPILPDPRRSVPRPHRVSLRRRARPKDVGTPASVASRSQTGTSPSTS